MKLGYLVPGTNIPIISDKFYLKNEKNKKVILNMAWHIKKEITNYIKKEFKFSGKIVNIISKRDF